MVIAAHIVMAICAFFAAGLFYSQCRGKVGQEMSLGIWIFFGLPAIGCAWYLRSTGHVESGLITGVIAVGLGLLRGRFYR